MEILSTTVARSMEDRRGTARVWVVNGVEAVATELAPRRGPRVTSAGKRVEAGQDLFAMLEKQSRVAVKVAVLEERPAAAARRSDVVMPLAESVDRRAETRAKVNFFACVRTEKFGEELVTCIDMSRGGVSFRSKNCYEKDQRVRIAVPFSRRTRRHQRFSFPGGWRTRKSWREARCGCAG
jgi:PilZ domain